MIEKIKAIWAWLDGKKSYIASGLASVVGFCVLMGWLDEGTALILLTFIGTLFGVSLRLAVAKGAVPNA